MKQSMFNKQSQKGFTLLELLIVVTIIAILSVGAILAYEGLTDKAQAASGASNTAGADQAIRNYRAVAKVYPNQWDQLVANNGGDLPFVADATYRVLAKVNASALSGAIAEAFEEVGMDEFQARATSDTTEGVEPNLQHSEGAAPNDAVENELDDPVTGANFFNNLVVIPTANSGALCTFGSATPTVIRADADALATAGNEQAAQNFMIKVNDNIGEDECHLVVAVGFGHDAAHSTVNSNVAIAAAPAFVGNIVKPADNYARYIGLFDLGVDGDDDDNVDADEVYSKPKLIGLIDPEGKVIDENVAAANDDTTN